MSTASAAQSNRAQNQTMQHRGSAAPATRPATEERTLRLATEEAAVLKIDLTGLPLPKVGGLTVDGFKPTLFQRLFGKR
jgi:hypothetical protein